MWHKMESLPKDGSTFILWDGKDYMMGYWERTALIKDGYLAIATPVEVTPEDQEVRGPYNAIMWHPMPEIK